MTAILTPESVSLHDTCKTFTLGLRARIDVLTFLEPISANRLAHGYKSILILDPELEDMSLGREAVTGEMPQQRLGHVARMLPAGADLDRRVTMCLPCLVRDPFYPVELENGARDALPGLWVVDGGHSLLDSNGAGSERQSIRLALQSCSGRRLQDGQVVGSIVSAGFGSGDGFNTECPDLTGSRRGGSENGLRSPKGPRKLCYPPGQTRWHGGKECEQG